MKVAIASLGCKVNIYESEYIISLLKENNFEIVDFTTTADIYLINTCSVTNESDKKSRNQIMRARKNNPHAIIVVMGCYSQVTKDEIDADIILGNKDKSHIIKILSEYLKNHQKIHTIYNLREEENFENMEIKHFENHTRAFVKIQDGCNAFCSYCIIPYTRGKLRSKPLETVVKEVEELVKNGYKEIVLTGIHTGKYGLDQNTNLETLLKHLITIKGLYKLRLSSIEINEITDQILDLMEQSDIIARHLHIPLQSGSNKILTSMNRKYDLKYFLDKVKMIRSRFPDISLTTDLILGFPDENEKDFQDTLETLAQIKFTKIHAFPYSKRNNTPAATMPNQIPNQVKKARVRKVIELSSQNEKEFYSKFIEKELIALTENRKDGKTIALTSNYIPVVLKEKLPNNKIVKIKILEVTATNEVTGVLVVDQN